jgi:hypothetical protein
MAAGFGPGDVSVLVGDHAAGKHFGIKEKTKAPEGAAAGAAIGGTLGAIVIGLVAVGSIALPGIGLLAAGPIVAALAGAGAGGATGGILGGLIGATMPEHEAALVKTLERGHILLAVAAQGERAEMVQKIFRETGAEGISRAA